MDDEDSDFLPGEEIHVEFISEEIDLSSDSNEDTSILPESMGNLALMGNPSHPNSTNETSTSRETFNEDLPAVHSYLGDNLEEVSGRNILPERRNATIPLLSGSYGTLLPGQTFPLTVRDYSRAEMLRRCVDGDHTFGCLAIRRSVGGDSFYGTTIEIYEYADEMGAVIVKGRARQRFKLIGIKSANANYKMAEVYILPEIKLQHPFNALHYSSLIRLRPSHKEKCRRLEAGLMTWPKWVYDMYDPELLVERAHKLDFLKQGLRTEKGQNIMPKDPTELSFWIATHLDADKKFFILTLNSAIPRLRWLLTFVNKYHQYSCVSCEAVIGKQTDVFAMSAAGAQSTYVNPEGYHHDTITLLKAENIVTISGRSTHFSWFPGYAWSIAVCRQCQKHLGWLFTATKPKMQPPKFWGLTRQSLDTRINPEQGDEEPTDLPVI